MTETAFPGGGSLDPNSYPGTDSERIEQAARAAFAAAHRAGFENISGDIMLALPHYTQAEFDEIAAHAQAK